MKCQEAKEHTFAYVKNELNEETARSIQSHLEICDACRREVEDVRTVLALIESASDSEVIETVNQIICRAIDDRVPLIHIEPEAGGIRVRVRRYGVLHESTRLPEKMQPAIAARLKMMAGMQVAERRIPQDGFVRFQRPDNNNEYDIRIACTPTMYGESFVIHIMDKSNVLIGIDNLDISPAQLNQIKSLMNRKRGWIITTGPSGSGKTTLLYSMLLYANSEEVKVMTVEDPIELGLKGVTQIPVNKKAGLTFSTGLRSIFRHDPDIIMCGETRDVETANTAVEAAITGHIMLSSLHTNDAPSALIRLVDMGVEPYLVTSALNGIIAQRLVRKICTNCKEEYKPDPNALSAIGFTTKEIESTTFYHGKGCEKCSNKGYIGRAPLVEVLIMNQELCRLLISREPLTDIRNCAIEHGMITLAEDAKRKIKEGLTDPEEAARVLEVDVVM